MIWNDNQSSLQTQVNVDCRNKEDISRLNLTDSDKRRVQLDNDKSCESSIHKTLGQFNSNATVKIGEPNFFRFTCKKTSLEMRIFYFLPEDWRPCDPVLFCMHGVQRNADNYVRNCSELLKQNGGKLVLICPEFSLENFPTFWHYNLGNIVEPFEIDCDDSTFLKIKSTVHWSFSLLEPIFDSFKEFSGSVAEGYHLYGHSAGAQFVHRYRNNTIAIYHRSLIFGISNRYLAMQDFIGTEGKCPRVIKSFAANAGYWTCPTMDASFPFGLGRLPLSNENLKKLLTSRLHILLGDQDTDENHEHLNRSAGAMRQGRHRLERGQTFHRSGVDAAKQVGVELGWTLEVVEGAGHSNKAIFTSVLRTLGISSPLHVARQIHGHGARSSVHVWHDWAPPRGHERRSDSADSSNHKAAAKDWHASNRNALALLGASNHNPSGARRHIWPV